MIKTRSVKHSLIVFLLLLVLRVSAQQNSGDLISGAAYFSVLTSTVKTARQPGETHKDYHFAVMWNSKQPPETMFWRGQNGWLPCSIRKTHTEGKGKRAVYITDGQIENLTTVKKGDIIIIEPVVGGRFPVPGEIPATAVNTLFFKTAGSGWLYYPVKKIKR
jgi:hypothetical protein